MAERPLFHPGARFSELVKMIAANHLASWLRAFPEEENVTELHEAAARAGYSPSLRFRPNQKRRSGSA